jgi:Flp pilus assembly protein TadD
MPSSRTLSLGLAAILIAAAPFPATAQKPSTPSLTRAQRALLDAVVEEVERVAASAPAAAPAVSAAWQTHVLRASDGSHYVAMRALAPDVPAPQGPVVLYVRLASRGERGVVTTAERSAVREWLRGERNDPLPMRAGGSMSVPRGEMPVGSIIPGGRDVAAESVAALRLMLLEHENAKKRRAEQEAARRAALEQAGNARPSGMLPFEDFDVAARLLAGAGGGVDLRRSLSAGPGDYDLYVGWTEAPPRGAAPVVHVLTHRVSLRPASPEFGLSDLVVADAVATIDAPYPADQQAAHPYAAGAIEVTPAAGNRLQADGSLALLVQVVNPSGSETGKPDVSVVFRIARLAGDRTEVVGTLPVQRYDAARLPVDFDVAKGHPLFAAARASLSTFSRGRYRVTALAQDHLSGRSSSAEADFEVLGTAASLLREAPRPGQAFARSAILTPSALAEIARGLTPSAPSPALREALAAAAEGRFAALVREMPVEPLERPIAQALRALGLYGLGDSPRSTAVPLQTALNAGAPEGPTLFLQGALQALSGDDIGAISAWLRARRLGVGNAEIAPLLVDAYTRRGDAAAATTAAQALLDANPADERAARTLAALHLAGQRSADALTLLDAPPLQASADMETRFLVLHALYAGIVAAPPSAATGAATDPGGTRFEGLAGAYVADGGPHAELVGEWLRVVRSRR